MAIEKIVKKVAVELEVNAGLDAKGKIIKRRHSITGINAGTSTADMLYLGKGFAEILSEPTENILTHEVHVIAGDLEEALPTNATKNSDVKGGNA